MMPEIRKFSNFYKLLNIQNISHIFDKSGYNLHKNIK